MPTPIKPAYQYSYISSPYQARPGMPARSYVYVAVASPGGAINTTKIPANTADTNPTVKVTPKKTFQINEQKGGVGTMTFYIGMPEFVPLWLRTQLLTLGLVT